MKQFKHLVWLVCLIGLIGFRLEVAQGAQITLRLAGNTTPDHQLTRGLELFAKLIEQKTKGAVTIQLCRIRLFHGYPQYVVVIEV